MTAKHHVLNRKPTHHQANKKPGTTFLDQYYIHSYDTFYQNERKLNSYSQGYKSTSALLGKAESDTGDSK